MLLGLLSLLPGLPAAPLCKFVSLDVGTLLSFAAGWELLYQLTKRYTSSSPHEKVVKLGASYSGAFANALVCSVGGCWTVMSLLAADHRDRLIMTPAESPYWPGGPTGEIVEWFAYSFLGWLLYDVVHVALWYPKLGRVDTLAHHIGFICLTSLGISYRRQSQATGYLASWPQRSIGPPTPPGGGRACLLSLTRSLGHSEASGGAVPCLTLDGRTCHTCHTCHPSGTA